jgi:hypothetical protein
MRIDLLQKLIRLEIQRANRIDKLRTNIADLNAKLHMDERGREFHRLHPSNPYGEIDILPDELVAKIPEWIESCKRELTMLEQS